MLGWNGCDVISDKTEGLIVYDIIYVKPPAESWKKNMMPSEMEFKFKNNKYVSTLDFPAVIDLSFYVDNNKMEVVEYAKVYNSKMAYKTTDKNLNIIFYL